MPNVLSPMDLVFRPDIVHKLYHQQIHTASYINHVTGKSALNLFEGACQVQ